MTFKEEGTVLRWLVIYCLLKQTLLQSEGIT